MLEIIKLTQEILKPSSFLGTSNVPSKLGIQSVIDDVDLIADVSELDVFGSSEDALNVFSRFPMIPGIAENITFSKKRVDSDAERRLETFYKHSFPLVKLVSELDKTLIIFIKLRQPSFQNKTLQASPEIDADELVSLETNNVSSMLEKEVHVTKISFFRSVFHRRGPESCRLVFIHRVKESDIARIPSGSSEGTSFEVIDS